LRADFPNRPALFVLALVFSIMDEFIAAADVNLQRWSFFAWQSGEHAFFFQTYAVRT
jgi:hypothetical protein